MNNDTINRDTRVEVYRNLHTGTWSVRDCQTGRVVGHMDTCSIYDAKLVVQPAGRRRVLRDKRKNVHAGIVGTIMAPVPSWDADWINSKGVPARKIPVTYNPYRFSTFVTKGPYQNDLGYTQFPVNRSDGAIFNGSAVYAVDLD